MKSGVHIDELVARYVLPASRRGERARLDRILDAVTSEYLEVELEHRGIPLHHDVCVRHVHVPVTLQLGASDDELARAWAAAFATRVERVIAGGRDDDVVVYTSRGRALLDFAVGVATNDARRAWAWRQLGLTSAPALSVDALVGALLGEPHAIVAILVELARERRLARVVEGWSALHVRRLAEAAIEAAGIRGAASLLAVVDEARRALPASGPHERDEDAGRLDVVRTDSRILAALQPAWRRMVTGAAGAADLLRAWAALAWLEVEPGVGRRPIGGLRDRLDRLVEAILRAHGSSAGAGRAGGEARGAMVAPSSPPSALRAEDATPGSAAGPGTAHATAFGGLLYCLNLIGAAGRPGGRDLVDELLAVANDHARPLRWTLAGLAERLTGADARDPAIAAFTGRRPDEPDPWVSEPPLTRGEADALDAIRERLLDRLAASLADEPHPPDALLDWVVRRRAEVSFDPGWIEARFSLRDVSVSIRKAGLDLDPGFVPWLGVVIRFVYQ